MSAEEKMQKQKNDISSLWLINSCRPIKKYFVIIMCIASQICVLFPTLLSIMQGEYLYAKISVVIIYGLAVWIDVYFFRFVMGSMESAHLEMLAEILEAYNKSDLERRTVTEQKTAEAEKIKKEIIHNLLKMQSLLEQKNAVENENGIQHLICETEIMLQQEKTIQYCDNAVVNILLADKKTFAEQKQIHIQVAAEIPDYLAIPMVDLCGVFINLIDNAIESVEMQEVEKRIDIKVTVISDYLVIKIGNPIRERPKKKNGSYVTTKKDKSCHGIGLQIVEEIAYANQGKLLTEINDDYFAAIVYLKK